MSDASTTKLGFVEQLWRYPAKSMQGERIDAVDVTGIGVVGDRGWAARDEVRGGIRGAKKIGALMGLAARYERPPTADEPVPPLVVTLPDGHEVRSTEPDFDAAISEALDHQITMWPLQPSDDTGHYTRGAPDSDDLLTELRGIFGRAEDEPLPDLSTLPPELVFYESLPGTYYDAYPIHLLTTSSLETLQARLPDSVIDARRFRPSIVVAVDEPSGDPFPEQSWVGQRVRLGSVELEVVSACPRCVMPTRGFADLPEDRSILRTIVRDAEQNLGVYATVVQPGSVRVGDDLTRIG